MGSGRGPRPVARHEAAGGAWFAQAIRTHGARLLRRASQTNSRQGIDSRQTAARDDIPRFPGLGTFDLVEPARRNAPEDARPTPSAPVVLHGLFQAERVAAGLLWALLPPFIATLSTAAVVPGAASWTIMIGGTAVIWAALALRPSVRFTAGALVIGLTFRSHRIAWADIESVSFDKVMDDDQDTVLRQVISVRYRRDPGAELPPTPTRLADYRVWNRAHFRTVRVPLSFPPSPADRWPPVPEEPGASRSARRRERQREIILREFAARGYSLPA